MMSTKTWGWIIAILLAAIILFVLLFISTKPSPSAEPAPAATTTPSESPQPAPSPGPAPLSSKVTVTSPQKGATVEHSFTVAGSAPGPWFFEAQFPVQVRDKKGNVIGRATGQAQGEWMTEKQVTFTAAMQIDANYHGPATLILMKDNPSGMPEHDDSVSIPIVVK